MAAVHYLQVNTARGHRKVVRRANVTLLATLDRIAIGSILRSKLVFLINVRRRHRPSGRAGVHSAECVDIDNESNQVP